MKKLIGRSTSNKFGLILLGCLPLAFNSAAFAATGLFPHGRFLMLDALALGLGSGFCLDGLGLCSLSLFGLSLNALFRSRFPRLYP